MASDDTELYICIIVKLEPCSVALEIVVVGSILCRCLCVSSRQRPYPITYSGIVVLGNSVFLINIPLCSGGCLPCVLLELTEINSTHDHTDFVCTRKEIEKVPYANTCFLLSAGIS